MRDIPLCVVAHDPGWGPAFTAETGALARHLAIDRPGIEHIGSTAVPGLAAKPIVDMMIGAHLLPARAWQVLLDDLGYQPLDNAVPGRLTFRRAGDLSFHLHVMRSDGRRWRNNLALRDYLRGSPAAIRRYEEAKRAALASAEAAVAVYSRHKAPCIRALLREATRAVPNARP